MFAILAFSCTDPAYCGPGGDSETQGYRTTPAMSDPYKYIRSGAYARILSHEITGPMQPGISVAEEKKTRAKAARERAYKALGLKQ